MHFDEATVRKLAYGYVMGTKGYWKVNDKCFFNKAECLRYASSIKNYNVTFHFFDEVYKTLDWSKEPIEDLDELYRRRAQQLRDKYEYLILWFSGGEDSKNILDVFLKNNIKLDEICAYAPVKALDKLRHYFDVNNKSPEFVIFEYEQAVVPVLNSLKNTNPEIKISIFDYTERSIECILSGNVHAFTKGGYNFSTQFVGGRMIHEHAVKLNRKLCNILGTDKPRIILNPYTQKFGQVFHDLTGSLADSDVGYSNLDSFTEGFYYTPDMPEITLKQSKVIKRNLESLLPLNENIDKLKKLVSHVDAERMIHIDVHDPYIERMLYPNLDFPDWQAKKNNSFFYMESGSWLFNSMLSEKKVIDFYNGQLKEFIYGIDNKFIRYNNHRPTHFAMYYTKPNWL